MDFSQRRLLKSEWDAIELPLSSDEIAVLRLLVQGYHDPAVRAPRVVSLYHSLKLPAHDSALEHHVFQKFLWPGIDALEQYIIAKLAANNSSSPEAPVLYARGTHYAPTAQIVRLNSVNRARLDQVTATTASTSTATTDVTPVYDRLLFQAADALARAVCARDGSKRRPVDAGLVHRLFFSVTTLLAMTVDGASAALLAFVRHLLASPVVARRISVEHLVFHCTECIEQNDTAHLYADLELYAHQRDIIQCFRDAAEESEHVPHLVMYTAPTGTGKTLTPIALSEGYRVIFVCAARHVGLALARAAVSIHKRVGFAFGCETAQDIRLHFSAAKEFSRDTRSGGIGRVNNANGSRVEIMICDNQSYLVAMEYMCTFFRPQQLIMYWDEPTITLDYVTHDCHAAIHANWAQNRVPNIVLSSATLPAPVDIPTVIDDFVQKYPHVRIARFDSHDCRKSIPMLDRLGRVVMPHFMSPHLAEVRRVAAHYTRCAAMMRYLDTEETCRFLRVLASTASASASSWPWSGMAAADVTVKRVKQMYLDLLNSMSESVWAEVSAALVRTRVPRFFENAPRDAGGAAVNVRKSSSIGPGSVDSGSATAITASQPLQRLSSQQITQTASPPLRQGTSGAYVTTRDAYALTDGPTLFMTDQVEKVARFCVQQAEIPSNVLQQLADTLAANNKLVERIEELEQMASKASTSASADTDASAAKRGGGGGDHSRKEARESEAAAGGDDMENRSRARRLASEANLLRAQIRTMSLSDLYVPNKRYHMKRWAPLDVLERPTVAAFTSSVDDDTVRAITQLHGVEDLWKVLLLMGIGVFSSEIRNTEYMEIMKRLATTQRLFLIIANSDYIYGTNYQFCHGFLSKDLQLTQEKIVQAMGRIGRGQIQQTYTVRFRDDAHLALLFSDDAARPEVDNMKRLFRSTESATPFACDDIMMEFLENL